MEKSCKQCGFLYTRRDNEPKKDFENRKFCSRDCFSESTKCTLFCNECKKEYRVSPSYKDGSLFCSKNCYKHYRSNNKKPKSKRNRIRKKNDVLSNGIKTCTKCLISKNRTDFFVDRIQSDGRSPECKLCSYIRRKNLSERSIDYRLRRRLRHRIYETVKNGRKTKGTLQLLGCSFCELKKHLESKFEIGMTWDNYGEWHIDHIKPCSLFNLENIHDQEQCFHYTNLQPLWALDNIKKGNRYVH